jgi:predicted DNA-binding protein YlxM (UPF0122 family)
MKKLRNLFFNLLARDGVPSRIEALYFTRKFTTVGHTYFTQRIHEVMSRYGNGESLEEIAKSWAVTRERIRQILMKGCRQGRQWELYGIPEWQEVIKEATDRRAKQRA